MHTNVILDNRRRTHAHSNYSNTKLKTWFRRLIRHPARKRSGPILHWYIPGPTRGELHRRTHTERGISESQKQNSFP